VKLPSYYLKRPAIDDSPKVVAAFERLFSEQIATANGRLIEYQLSAPKWQLLNYLCDTKDVVMHGSGDPAISEFEPRQSNDVQEFGDQKAVYAASDGIWASYFAIVDRDGPVTSLVNSCTKIVFPRKTSETAYFFSINDDALPHNPWRTGTVYVLPRETFEMEESLRADRESTQWRSFEPVKPLAKIKVVPEEFPFLDQIRGHDFDTIQKRATQDTDGFPWLTEAY
jgi:hypothetical protein